VEGADMKTILIEAREHVLEYFKMKPVPSFTEISKQTGGVHRVTIHHWFRRLQQ